MSFQRYIRHLEVFGKKYQKKSVDFMFFVCYYKKAFGEKKSSF